VITVTDSLGNTVYSGAAPSLTSGLHSFSWNGKDTSGAQLPDGGTYTMAISAKDSAGNKLSSQVLTIGTVTAASLNNGTAYVTVNGSQVPASSIVSVQPASSSSSSGS
jgi:flagellar basal-body rod modification protein FlgD